MAMIVTFPWPVRQDTREQKPYDFGAHLSGVEVRRAAIKAGDYAIDLEPITFAVERKSIEDFIGSITTKKAMSRELRKRRHGIQLAYVVDGTWSEYLFRRIPGAERITPQLRLKAFREFVLADGVGKMQYVHFAGDQHNGALVTLSILRQAQTQK